MQSEDVTIAVFAALPVVLGAVVFLFFRRLRTRGSAASPSRGKLVLGNALACALLLSVATLIGECWIRFAFDRTDAFGATFVCERWFRRHYRTNSDGFRDDFDYRLGAAPAAERRVTFVGDSFTAGHGVADVNDRFANRVRAARPNWEVHVMAMCGWDTGQELDLLNRILPETTRGEYRYDEVVLVYFLNDICDMLPGIEDYGRRIEHVRERGFLARSSYLFDMLRFVWAASTDSQIRAYFPMVASAYDGATWEMQERRLDALRKAVTSRGGRLSVVTFPMMQLVGPDYPLRDVHRRLDAFWRGEGVAHLDLLDVFDGRAAGDLVVNRFDPHPNEEAHRIVADALLPFLDAEMKRPRAAR